MTRRYRTLAIVVAAVLAGGCAATRPVLYPNAHLDRAEPARAEHDVEECLRGADAHVSSRRGRHVARDTTVGGGSGAAIGAAGGAVYGSAGGGAAAGAATGATAGLMHALLGDRRPSTTYRHYVEACLGERGYHVIGWE